MTIQELAQEYAQLLVAYHKISRHVEADQMAYGSALREDLMAKHRAMDALVNAQNRLNDAAQYEAEQEAS